MDLGIFQDKPNPVCCEPIYRACHNGCHEALEIFLNAGFSHGDTEMKHAASFGGVACVKLLAEYGGDLGELTLGRRWKSEPRGALHYAKKNDREDVVEYIHAIRDLMERTDSETEAIDILRDWVPTRSLDVFMKARS